MNFPKISYFPSTLLSCSSVLRRGNWGSSQRNWLCWRGTQKYTLLSRRCGSGHCPMHCSFLEYGAALLCFCCHSGFLKSVFLLVTQSCLLETWDGAEDANCICLPSLPASSSQQEIRASLETPCCFQYGQLRSEQVEEARHGIEVIRSS